MNIQLESVAAFWQITIHTKSELFMISCDIWKIAKLAIVVGKKWHPHLQSQQYAHLEFAKMRTTREKSIAGYLTDVMSVNVTYVWKNTENENRTHFVRFLQACVLHLDLCPPKDISSSREM